MSFDRLIPMESSYQHGNCVSSFLDAVTEAGPAVDSSVSANIETDFEHEYQLFTRAVSQHEYHPLPHQLLNQRFVQPSAESYPMQFNPLHCHQEQVHRLFLPSHLPSFTPVQEQPQTLQKPTVIDLRRLLGFENQSHHLHESTHRTGQTWTSVLPQNDVSGQQNSPELPRRLLPDVPSASIDSTCRTGTVHFDDWMSQAYRELQSIREMHLSDLSKIYVKICNSGLQPLSTEQAAKLEHNKSSIERMVQFLNLPGTEIVRFNKDKFYYSLYMIIKCVHTYKSRGSIPVQVYAQSLSQLPLLQQWLKSELQSQAANPGSSGNIGSPQLKKVQEDRTNLLLNKTELNRNMTIPGVDLRNVSSLVRMASSSPSPLNTFQKTNFPPTIPPKSATSSPKLKQSKNPTMHIQPLKQPTNQPLTEEIKNQMLIQRVNEINEKQQFEYSPRSLFPSPWLKVPSGEIPSLSIGQKYPKQPDFNGSSSKSVTSPFFIGSPLSPAMPSSSPVCLEKFSSVISSLAVWDTSEHPQKTAENFQPPLGDSSKHTLVVKSAQDPQPLIGESSGCSQRYVGVTLASIENQPLAFGEPDKSASLSPVDLTVPKENQRTSDKELSAKCLSEMVESMSPEALIASVQDIMSIFTLIDKLSEAMFTSESLRTICEDLAADTHHSERRHTSLLCKGTTHNMRNRNISTRSSCSSSFFNEKDRDGCDPFNGAVLEEIKQINQSLIETVVDVASDFKEDVDAGFHVDAVVRCSYSAVGLDFSFNQRNTLFTKLPVLLVELLLPENYPKSSPRVVDTSSFSCSEAGESEDLSERAKLMFSLLLRKLPEPFSLSDMARTWDYCARSVLSEFAQRFGGGSFSSIYGSWESCTTAA